ncbi:MAG: rhodanese-like domain-containing protein, partial [Pseudomonadota bacterium]
MKKHLTLLLLMLGLFVAPALIGDASADQPGKEVITVINTDQLKKLLDSAAPPMVFDARNPEEYQEVHIKGALSLPEPKFAEFAHLLPTDKSSPLVFYCNGVKCGKSKKAAAKALALGYGKVLIYAEGMPV